MRTAVGTEGMPFFQTNYNKYFNPVEFDGFRKNAGLNTFTLTPKQWIGKINTIGITSKAGRYGGTSAHKDIATKNKNNRAPRNSKKLFLKQNFI